MKQTRKKVLALLLCLAFSFLFSGCEDHSLTKYRNYVKSLIAINYLGATKDYMKATGATEEEADALYRSNVMVLKNNLLNYYNINIADAPGMDEPFFDLAKNIYSKVNYSVSKPYKDGSAYLIDVTIHPINLFSQTANDITTYVNTFNSEVLLGTYNDYTAAEYEELFAGGMLDILNEACLNMTYAAPVTISVEIRKEDNLFFISEHDFLKIDAAMISAAIELEPDASTPPTDTAP